MSHLTTTSVLLLPKHPTYNNTAPPHTTWQLADSYVYKTSYSSIETIHATSTSRKLATTSRARAQSTRPSCVSSNLSQPHTAPHHGSHLPASNTHTPLLDACDLHTAKVQDKNRNSRTVLDSRTHNPVPASGTGDKINEGGCGGVVFKV